MSNLTHFASFSRNDAVGRNRDMVRRSRACRIAVRASRWCAGGVLRGRAPVAAASLRQGAAAQPFAVGLFRWRFLLSCGRPVARAASRRFPHAAGAAVRLFRRTSSDATCAAFRLDSPRNARRVHCSPRGRHRHSEGSSCGRPLVDRALGCGGIGLLAIAEMATACHNLATAPLGLSVPPLFRAPYRSISVTEFWARRWNLAASEALHVFCFRPLSRYGAALALVAAFAASAAGHAFLAGLALKGWRPAASCAAFFMVQPVVMIIERRLKVRRWSPVRVDLDACLVLIDGAAGH